MSRYIIKVMYLEKPKCLIIWNRGSISLSNTTKMRRIAYMYLLLVLYLKGREFVIIIILKDGSLGKHIDGTLVCCLVTKHIISALFCVVFQQTNEE